VKNFFELLYNGLYRFSTSGKSGDLKFGTNNPNSFEFLREERKKQIQEKLGITIKNQNYFDEALIHRSYLHLLPKGLYKSNERLEFLGDSVLGFIVTEYLFHKYPNLPEGDLTKLRSWLVNKHSLSVVAKKLEIDKLLLISFGTAKTLERSGETILSDALEAIIGAIYLDTGYKSAKKFVTKTLIPLIQKEEVFQDKNYKSILMETVQAEGKAAPTYEVLEEEGPPHDKTFRVGVFVDNILLATGIGRSKKEAEQNAAKNALEIRNVNKKDKGEQNGNSNLRKK